MQNVEKYKLSVGWIYDTYKRERNVWIILVRTSLWHEYYVTKAVKAVVGAYCGW